MAQGFSQDMPPKGGYKNVHWEKIAKPMTSGYKAFGAVIGMAVVGWTWHAWERSVKRQMWVEENDAKLALEPLLTAERERAYLKQLRENRDEENEVMKNVPGWETGTLYGEPVYYNQADRFPAVSFQEYFAHNRWYDQYKRMFDHIRH